MRLIDADICLNKAWQNFYKQEDEHEKNIDGYDIVHDRFYEQSGFECCQQTIVEAPTVEAIPKADIQKALKKGSKDISKNVLAIVREEYISKADYENRLKADLVAMLTEIQLEIEELDTPNNGSAYMDCVEIIQQKINVLRG